MSRTALVYRLRDAAVYHAHGALVKDLAWNVRDQRVTVLLGPAGVGKSALVRGLAGVEPPRAWSYDGDWFHRGIALHGFGARSEPSGIAWAPQSRAHRFSLTEERAPALSWRDALRTGRPTILLDEPNAGCSAAEIAEIEQMLARHREHGSAIVVTHDLGFARQIANDVALLAGGKMLFAGPADEFFTTSNDPLVRRFREQGNCWPEATGPQLPPHFCWVVPAQLAGMGRPGLLGREEDDLEALAGAGISLLVSLTERAFPAAQLKPYGIVPRHFPISDMGVPAQGPTASLCAEIVRTIRSGGRVAVHCHAGLGRTGTILAAVLVWQGQDPEQAVAEIRSTGRAFIQSEAQMEFVRRFAETT